MRRGDAQVPLVFGGKELPLHQCGLPVETQFAGSGLPLRHAVGRGLDGGVHQVEAHVQEERLCAPVADQVDGLVRQDLRQVPAGRTGRQVWNVEGAEVAAASRRAQVSAADVDVEAVSFRVGFLKAQMPLADMPGAVAAASQQ